MRDKVMMSSSDTKFDDTTVTGQPMSPSIPTMIMPTLAQVIMGRITHLRFLNIMNSRAMQKMSIVMPNVLRSLRM